MATNPPLDTQLTPLGGKPRTLREQLTTFHLALVAIEPRVPQSRWIIPTATRLFQVFDESDCRVAWLISGDDYDANKYLTERQRRFVTFVDPERKMISALGLEGLPALVHLGANGAVLGAVEGWQPREWALVANRLARFMGFPTPQFPAPDDPGPFAGVAVSAAT